MLNTIHKAQMCHWACSVCVEMEKAGQSISLDGQFTVNNKEAQETYSQTHATS